MTTHWMEMNLYLFVTTLLYLVDKTVKVSLQNKLVSNVLFSFNLLQLDYVKHFFVFEKLFSSLTSHPIYRGNIDSFNYMRSSVENSLFDHIIPLALKSPSNMVPSFLNYLYFQHPLTKFTHDVEVDNCISSLDVKVEKLLNTFETGLFRKNTFIGLLTMYRSAVPGRFKFNLIQRLVTRALRICSTFFTNLAQRQHFCDIISNKKGFLIHWSTMQLT